MKFGPEHGHLRSVVDGSEEEERSDRPLEDITVRFNVESVEELNDLERRLADMGPVVVKGQPGQEIYALSATIAGKPVYLAFPHGEGATLAVVFAGIEEVSISGRFHDGLRSVQTVAAAVFYTARTRSVETKVSDFETRTKMGSRVNNNSLVWSRSRVAFLLGSSGGEFTFGGLEDDDFVLTPMQPNLRLVRGIESEPEGMSESAGSDDDTEL